MSKKIFTFADGRTFDPTSVRYNELMQSQPDFARNVIGYDMTESRYFSDAGDASAFLIGQLTYLENQVYQVQTIPTQYCQLLDVDSSAGGAASDYGYQIYDVAGLADDVSPVANDLPEVQIAYGYVNMKIASSAVKYSYSTHELRESAFLRRPITEAKAKVTFQAMDQFINNVALVGKSSKGFTGLLNNPNVPTASSTASGTTIGSGTTAQAISDICAGIYNVYVNSAYMDLPNVIGLPPSIFNYLSQNFPGTTALQSLLEWIRANNFAKAQAQIDIKFVSIPQLETMGAGNSRRIVFYTKDWDRVRYIYPMPLKYLAPQFRDLKVHVPAEARYSGTAIYYPQSAYYIDRA